MNAKANSKLEGDVSLDKVQFSVVIPVYMGSETITELYLRLGDTLKKLSVNESYQIIFVDDHSQDNSWEILSQIAKSDEKVISIKLSKNFGQHAALTAGLHHATGRWVIIMDCDLQDIPEEIPKLYSATQEGYQVAVGKKISRNDPKMKILTSQLFSRVYRKLTNTNLKSNVGNFGIYSDIVIKNIVKMPEQNRSFGLLALWVGFDRKEVPVEHGPRFAGESNYNLRKRAKLALDSLLSYSNKVLNLTIYIGLSISFVAFGGAALTLVRFVIYGNTATGWTSIILLVLLSIGIQMTALGIVALYIGKIYDEVKQRPIFLIEKIVQAKRKQKNEEHLVEEVNSVVKE